MTDDLSSMLTTIELSDALSRQTESLRQLDGELHELKVQLGGGENGVNPPTAAAKKNMKRSLKKKEDTRSAMLSGEVAAAAKKQGAAVLRLVTNGWEEWIEKHQA